MNATEDYFLLLLHTHVVTSAIIMKFNLQTSVIELEKLITVNFKRWPQIDASKNYPAGGK